MKLELSRQICKKYSNTKLHENLSSGSQVVQCWQKHMMKLTVAFHNFTNAPKKQMPVPEYGDYTTLRSVFG
jgi:hypothetical protein